MEVGSMDFALTFPDEVEAFRKEVGTWLDQNAPKLMHVSDPNLYTDADDQARVDLRKALGKKGWLYPTAPKERGGGGLTMDHAIVMGQEMDKRDIHGITALGHMAAACILIWGT